MKQPILLKIDVSMLDTLEKRDTVKTCGDTYGGVSIEFYCVVRTTVVHVRDMLGTHIGTQ